jgi:hypothetical protein
MAMEILRLTRGIGFKKLLLTNEKQALQNSNVDYGFFSKFRIIKIMRNFKDGGSINRYT